MDTDNEASITRIPRGRLVVGWNASDRIERDLELKKQRGDDKTDAVLGTSPL